MIINMTPDQTSVFRDAGHVANTNPVQHFLYFNLTEILKIEPLFTRFI